LLVIAVNELFANIDCHYVDVAEPYGHRCSIKVYYPRNIHCDGTLKESF